MPLAFQFSFQTIVFHYPESNLYMQLFALLLLMIEIVYCQNGLIFHYCNLCSECKSREIF